MQNPTNVCPACHSAAWERAPAPPRAVTTGDVRWQFRCRECGTVWEAPLTYGWFRLREAA